jgi:hypothetical protein
MLAAAVIPLGASAGRGLGGGVRLGGFGGFGGSGGTQASEQYRFRQSRSSFLHSGLAQYRFSFAVSLTGSTMDENIVDSGAMAKERSGVGVQV